MPVFGVAALAAATAAPVAADGGQHGQRGDHGNRGPVYLMTSAGPVLEAHAFGTQHRRDDSIRVGVHTHGLIPGTSPVVFAAIFNHTRYCVSGAPFAICDPSSAGIPAVGYAQPSLAAGKVDAQGRLEVRGLLNAANGLTNADGAEIQVVILDFPVAGGPPTIQFAVLDPSPDGGQNSDSNQG